VSAPVAVVVAFVVAALATPLAMTVARRTGIVDRPGALKVHEVAVPYLGGVGVAAGLAAPLLTRRPALALPLAGALVLGVVDDAADVPPRARLLAEVVVGVGVGLAVPIDANRALGIVLVAAATVLLVNGMNMIDGLDALAASVGIVGALGFAIALAHDDRVVALALAGALAGFLVWNRPPARVYLGDGGAYLAGATLAALAASAFRTSSAADAPVALLLCAGYPVAELAVAVLRRARARQALFAGDREHVYDRVARRAGPLVAVGVAVLGAAVLTAAGVVAARATTAVAVVTVTVAAVLIVCGAAAGGFLSPESPESPEARS